MKDVTNELLAAVVAANAEGKAAALAVLRGEPAAGSGRGRREIEPYVGLKDVAGFLGVSARSVWRWRVPGHKLGSRTRFKLSEVGAYLESAAFKARTEELKEVRRRDEE